MIGTRMEKKEKSILFWKWSDKVYQRAGGKISAHILLRPNLMKTDNLPLDLALSTGDFDKDWFGGRV